MKKQLNSIRKKGVGGRPKLSQEAVRSRTIGVRVNELEMDKLIARAKTMGMSPAQWLRHAALDRKLPSPPAPEVNRDMYVEFSRIGVSLNQLARAANKGLPVTLQKEPEILLNLLRQVQLAILGVSDDSESN
ncbi:hypothetical protein [Halodesulfovibrio sp.]|jgi:hypothetical protein|uniref:plasmid mobilization protein n=1 Tax=Halodesulfovibrio sp. TaxID=1912772 RepID=UPI0025E1E1C7|nr:hypothetical protein [Halodesulfovibrio sp.]MCT4628015.1 mobilization protein [Halodesulfovibrio sp.]